MDRIIKNLKLLFSLDTDVDVANLLKTSKGNLNNAKMRNSIGPTFEKILDSIPSVSLDACVADSHPQLYQLSKNAADLAIKSEKILELEALLNEFIFKSSIEHSIAQALLAPEKELPFFQNFIGLLSSKKNDKDAILKLFEFVLKSVQSQKTGNSKNKLLAALSSTSRFQLNGLSIFLEKDFEGLKKVIEGLDDRVADAILNDISLVVELLQKMKG